MKNNEFKEKLIDVLDYLAVISLKMILVGIALLIVFGVLVCNEIKGAKNFCKSVDGEYKFTISDYPTPHSCNNKPIFQFKRGWNYDISSKNISLEGLDIN